jgi:c(7)-type cytochrome triheme protein
MTRHRIVILILLTVAIPSTLYAIGMGGMAIGKSCGACHDGATAFGVAEACDSCHAM